MLVKSLDASARIFCAGEIFHTGPNIHHREFQFLHVPAKRNAILRMFNAVRTKARVRNHLRWYFDRAGIGVAAVGFKLMTSQTRTFPWLIGMLRDCDVIPLFLMRKDVLATAISYYKAKATGQFHSDRTGIGSEPGKIAIDENEFRRIVRLCVDGKRQLTKLHRVNGGVLLAYEDMISDWDGFISTIGRAIGVPDLKVDMAISRLRPGIDSAQFLVDESTLRERFRAVASE